MTSKTQENLQLYVEKGKRIWEWDGPDPSHSGSACFDKFLFLWGTISSIAHFSWRGASQASMTGRNNPRTSRERLNIEAFTSATPPSRKRFLQKILSHSSNQIVKFMTGTDKWANVDCRNDVPHHWANNKSLIQLLNCHKMVLFSMSEEVFRSSRHCHGSWKFPPKTSAALEASISVTPSTLGAYGDVSPPITSVWSATTTHKAVDHRSFLIGKRSRTHVHRVGQHQGQRSAVVTI